MASVVLAYRKLVLTDLHTAGTTRALTRRPDQLVELIGHGTPLLASAVDSMGADQIVDHPWGEADRSGLAAMACDELLVHCWDACRGLDVEFEPPQDLCESILQRIFPWAPPDGSRFDTLLWANGRRALPGHPRLPRRWRWYSAPLTGWDGGGPKVGAPGGVLVNIDGG